MSPRWNRSVRLQVGRDAVAAVARAGWPRAVVVARARRAVEAGAAHAQAVEAVLQDLAAQTPLAGARLEAEIASALLHLDVVEGDFGGRTDRQLQGIAAACVAEMLGDDAARCAVRWHLQRDDRHLLVAAIAQDWLDLLQSAAKSAGLRLASVAPEFVVRWNACGGATKPGDGVFAVCAATDLAIAAVADGAVAAISVGAAVDLGAAQSRPEPPATAAASRVAAAGFSPDRRAMATVDERVDRFLCGRGQDPAAQSAFVLVAADEPAVAASARWSVRPSREMRA